jgi:hypothetical protein
VLATAFLAPAVRTNPRQFDAFARTHPNTAIKLQEITDPLSGKVTVTYDGVSDDSYSFLLENHSEQTINFFGERRFWLSGAIPWSAGMSCSGGPSRGADIENPAFGGSSDTNKVKLSPGDRLRLTIHKSEITSAHQGGHCKLELELTNHSMIESNDFQP